MGWTRATKRGRRCWRKEAGSCGQQRRCITRNPRETAPTSAFQTSTTTTAALWRLRRQTELQLSPAPTHRPPWPSISSNREPRKSCWNPEVADWNEGPCSRGANLPATCPDTIRSPRTWWHGATSPNRARPPALLTPQRKITAAPISPFRSTSLRSGSRKNPSTPPTMWRSWTHRLLKPRLNTSKMARRSTLERSSVSRPHRVSYPNRPATGSEKTSLNRATKAESKWAFT